MFTVKTREHQNNCVVMIIIFINENLNSAVTIILHYYKLSGTCEVITAPICSTCYALLASIFYFNQYT